jgi:O-acetyl-ADP-ribose deacetylase (regulator of RNase III)
MSGPSLLAARGDITRSRCDAIVNAASETLLGGGGVDGAIHAVAGPELLAACRALPEVTPGVRCPTGEARITLGFRLPARYVIHTVGPVYRGYAADAELLAAAHRSSLELAVSWGLGTVAFPAISCGVFGYPPEQAARIAVAVATERAWPLAEIRFVLFSDTLLTVWQRRLDLVSARSIW